MAALRPDGVVVEFDFEQFEERTARWCFDRLTPPEPDVEPGGLARHRSAWADSGGTWDDHRALWAADERLHSGAAMLSVLDARFDRRTVSSAQPYLFTDLARTTQADEQSAITAGLVPKPFTYAGLLVVKGWWPGRCGC